jgi:hypothetical protein
VNERPLTLQIRRYRPQRAVSRGGRPVAVRLYLQLRRGSQAVARLPAVSLVAGSGGPPQPLPADRARAWEELTRWMCHLVVFGDPAVVAGQNENKHRWQAWAHQGAPRPSPAELYDWQRDEAALERLRPRFRRCRERLVRALGAPRVADFEALYPSETPDLGLSEKAQRIVRQARAVFGPDLVSAGR